MALLGAPIMNRKINPYGAMRTASPKTKRKPRASSHDLFDSRSRGASDGRLDDLALAAEMVDATARHRSQSHSLVNKQGTSSAGGARAKDRSAQRNDTKTTNKDDQKMAKKSPTSPEKEQQFLYLRIPLHGLEKEPDLRRILAYKKLLEYEEIGLNARRDSSDATSIKGSTGQLNRKTQTSFRKRSVSVDYLAEKHKQGLLQKSIADSKQKETAGGEGRKFGKLRKKLEMLKFRRGKSHEATED